MPTTPTPGRIPPIQTAVKKPSVLDPSPSAAQSGKDNAKSAKKAVDLVAGASLSASTSGVSLGAATAGMYLNSRVAKQNKLNMARFRRNIDEYGRGSVPKANGRISTLGQAAFISFGTLIDLTETILDCFAVGVVVNRIIDIVTAIIFFVYCQYKGLSIVDNWKIYASIIGTAVGEFIPILDVAPFFVLDAWYITHTLKQQIKAEQKQMNTEAEAIVKEKERQNWMESYAKQQEQIQIEENEQQIQETASLENEPQVVV